jgi:hypothetical protein
MCSGKVYFELLKARRTTSNNEVAVVRVEQLYPFPVAETEAMLAKYPNAREVVWCQEEPQNQGAWYQIRHRLQTLVGKRELLYAGRPPAAGAGHRHHQDSRTRAARTHRGRALRYSQGRRGTRYQAAHADGCGTHDARLPPPRVEQTLSLDEQPWPLKSRFPNYPSRLPMRRS